MTQFSHSSITNLEMDPMHYKEFKELNPMFYNYVVITPK